MCRFLTVLLLMAVSFCRADVVFGIRPSSAVIPAGGLAVDNVHAGTPAAAAGLRAGDVIRRVDAVEVQGASSLRKLMSEYSAGDVVRVEYFRDGRPGVALVELVDRTAPLQCGRENVELTPEMQVQFMQAKSRLRILLSVLPSQPNISAVLADMNELVLLSKRVPSTHPSWMQGKDVEATVTFTDAQGSIVLQAHNDSLQIEILNNKGKVLFTFPINSTAQCRSLPPQVVRRLQAL